MGRMARENAACANLGDGVAIGAGDRQQEFSPDFRCLPMAAGLSSISRRSRVPVDG